MHVNLFLGIPLHSIGEPKRTVMRGQRAKSSAQPCEGRRRCRQAQIVMRLGKMDEVALGFGNADGLGQIAVNLVLVITLKDFGVGPVHAGVSQQAFGHMLVPAQTFQHEDGIGILHPHLGDDVFPGFERDLVPRIAAEPVNALAAPEKKNPGHVFPETPMRIVKLGEICPQYAPSAG